MAGKMYAGGSANFDEKTGKYRNGATPMKPGIVTTMPVNPNTDYAAKKKAALAVALGKRAGRGMKPVKLY
jgi:hypothetical protein